jgi:iron-regulated transporter 1
MACLLWILIVSESSSKNRNERRDDPAPGPSSDAHSASVLNGAPKSFVFAIILVIGIIEYLSRRANVLSMERDWVPLLAPPSLPTANSEQRTLAHVNSVMARIDIGCKLIAPIAVTGFSSLVPLGVVLISVIVFNLLGAFLEILTAWEVWKQSDVLRKPKVVSAAADDFPTGDSPRDLNWTAKVTWLGSFVVAWWSHLRQSFEIYFSSEVWIPSIAMTMTQSSILSVSGILIVFLLNSGYSLKTVTIAETLSALFELSSTFSTPYAVSRLLRSRVAQSYELGEVLETANGNAATRSMETEEFLRESSAKSSPIEASFAHGPPDSDDHNQGAQISTIDPKVEVSKVGLWGIVWMFVALVSIIFS